MPDQKISVDPAAADLSGCIIPVVTGGVNKQAANSLFGITGVANGVIYSAGNRNTSDPTNFNYVPGTQTLTVVGPIRTSPVTNEATVATPANGMIIYSTALSKFRAYENGAWVNLIGGGGGTGWALTGVSTLTGVATITSNAKNQHIFNGTWTATAAADAHIAFGGTLTAASGLGVTGCLFNPILNAAGTSSVQVGLDINPTFAGGTTPVNISARFRNGFVVIQTDAINETPTTNSGLALINTTAATNVLQQYSPSLRFRGSGWKTTATAASQTVDFTNYVAPLLGTTKPNARMIWASSINGGTAAPRMYIDTDGYNSVGGGLTIEGQTDPNGADLNLYFNKDASLGAPAANDRISEFHSYANNSSAAKTQYTAIYSDILSPTAGAEGGRQRMNITSNGGLVEYFLAEPSASLAKLTIPCAIFDGNSNNVTLGNNLGTPAAHFRYTNTTAGRQVMGFVNASVASAYAEFQVTNDLGMGTTTGLKIFKFTSAWGTGAPYFSNGVTIQTGSAVTGGLNFSTEETSAPMRFYTGASSLLAMTILSDQNISIGSTSSAAKLYVIQAALSSSWLPALRIDPGAHTSMTAATEFKDYNFTTRTATWLAGTTATQRFAHFQGQTVAGASASATFTDLYTVYIDPSIQGSQAIITNNWALGLGGGLKLFAGTTTRPALVIPTGTNLTTSQAGAMENDGTHLWFTFANSGARWQLDNQVGTFGWALAGNTLIADGIIGDIGTGGFKISLYTNNTARQVISSKGNFTFTQDAQSTSHTFITYIQSAHTGGSPIGLAFTGGGHSTLAAGTTANDIIFNLNRTVQFATGAFNQIQAAISISAPTYSFVGASTMANTVATLYVNGPPIAGSNATINGTYGIYIDTISVGAGSQQAYGLVSNAPTGAVQNFAAGFGGGAVLLSACTTTYPSLLVPGGTLMTTAKVGGIENDGTNLFFTVVSNTRLAVGMNAKAATPLTTGTMTTTLTNLSAITITPTGACTFNASGGISGQRCAFVITTSGASSFVLTWGTNYKTTGTLATGTVTAKVFTVEFLYDGTNWNEVARTVAM